MRKIDGGATIWARQTTQSDIFYWKPAEWFKIWFFIVNKVNHKDNKLFKRGENYFNWSEIKNNDLKGITDDQWYKCIKWLKRAKQITTQKTTRGNIIFVINYHKYQTLINYKSKAQSDTKGKAEAKQKQSRSYTINKNDNNDKNEKNNPKGLGQSPKSYGNPLINKFLEYLKAKTEIIDTAVKYQRTDSWILIRKMKSLAKQKKGGEPTDDEVWNGLKFLVDTACADKFHNQRAGNIRYLYNNIGAVVKSKLTNKRKVI